MEPNQENSQNQGAEFVVKKVESSILPKDVRQNLGSAPVVNGVNLDKPSFISKTNFIFGQFVLGFLFYPFWHFLLFVKVRLPQQKRRM